jgi:hypothetical protein
MGAMFFSACGATEKKAKEGNEAVKMVRLSCHKFRSDEVWPWLTIIAYNFDNQSGTLVLPQRIVKWSLRCLQQRLVKTCGRLV